MHCCTLVPPCIVMFAIFSFPGLPQIPPMFSIPSPLSLSQDSPSSTLLHLYLPCRASYGYVPAAGKTFPRTLLPLLLAIPALALPLPGKFPLTNNRGCFCFLPHTPEPTGGLSPSPLTLQLLTRHCSQYPE